MKTISPQFELPGTESVFNLAVQVQAAPEPPKQKQPSDPNAGQFALDLDGIDPETQLRAQWAKRIEADAGKWTVEAMAQRWAGVTDSAEWVELPGYERERIVALYKAEQAALEWEQRQWDEQPELRTGPRPSRIYDYATVSKFPDRESIEQHRAIAEKMAQQLAADWSANRPPSVFTYDAGIAATVTMILGRRVEAIKPSEDL